MLAPVLEDHAQKNTDEFAPEEDQIVRDFRRLADFHANRIQWSEDDHEDLVQEGMLELIKTIRSYRKSGRPILDAKALASICFSSAMKWWYKKSDRTLAFAPLETANTIKVENGEHYFATIFVDQYLAELERLHGAIAREIVENLISPGPKVGDAALAAMASKQARKDTGESVIGYAAPPLPRKHLVREALGLHTVEFDRLMATIKQYSAHFVTLSAPKPQRNTPLSPAQQLYRETKAAWISRGRLNDVATAKA